MSLGMSLSKGALCEPPPPEIFFTAKLEIFAQSEEHFERVKNEKNGLFLAEKVQPSLLHKAHQFLTFFVPTLIPSRKILITPSGGGQTFVGVHRLPSWAWLAPENS